MKVLHIITGLKKGGAERVVLDLCKYHTGDECPEVIVISRHLDLLETFIDNGIKVHLCDSNASIFGLFKAVRTLLRVHRRGNFDVVHSHMTHSMILACFLGLKTRHIHTPHNTNLGGLWRNYTYFLLKPFRQIDLIFEKRSAFWYHKNPTEFPNGIDFESYADRLQRDPNILNLVTAGRLTEAKNHVFLIELIGALKEEGVIVKLDIYGEGHLKSVLDNLIAENNLVSDVFLKGYCESLSTVLPKYDAFILPSLWEGLPIVILEAIATGLPIVSTDVGSIKNILSMVDLETCDLNEFKWRILDLKDHYDYHWAKARELREKAQKIYDVRSVEQKLQGIYRNV